MKIYRVTHKRTFDEHDGYSFFSNKTKAQQAQRKANMLYKDEGFTYVESVEELECEISAKGILKFLNAYASHSDNG